MKVQSIINHLKRCYIILMGEIHNFFPFSYIPLKYKNYFFRIVNQHMILSLLYFIYHLCCIYLNNPYFITFKRYYCGFFEIMTFGLCSFIPPLISVFITFLFYFFTNYFYRILNIFHNFTYIR